MMDTFCPNCKNAIDPSAIYCPLCGTDQRPPSQRPAVPLQQVASAAATPALPRPSTTAISLVCIVCGNTDVQKVSAICQAGSWTGTGTVTTVASDLRGHMMFGGGVMQAGGATRLAQALAPPPRPSVPVPIMGWIAGVCAFLGLMFVMAAFLFYQGAATSNNATGQTISHETSESETDAFVFCSVSAAVLGVVALVLFLQQRVASAENDRTYRQAFFRWQEAMSNWHNLYYCPRCDGVYNLATQQYAPSLATHSLL